jgi:hypothetical protein
LRDGCGFSVFGRLFVISDLRNNFTVKTVELAGISKDFFKSQTGTNCGKMKKLSMYFDFATHIEVFKLV